MKIGIIIPCYNQESKLNIAAFRNCLRDSEDFHLCFVNNGSRDNTMEVLTKLKDEFDDRISIINMRKKQSDSLAIRAGARFFYSLAMVEYVGFFDLDDADNFYDFNELLHGTKANKKLKMVFGTDINDIKPLRRMAQWLLSAGKQFYEYLFVFEGELQPIPIRVTRK